MYKDFFDPPPEGKSEEKVKPDTKSDKKSKNKKKVTFDNEAAETEEPLENDGKNFLKGFLVY